MPATRRTHAPQTRPRNHARLVTTRTADGLRAKKGGARAVRRLVTRARSLPVEDVELERVAANALDANAMPPRC